MDFTKDVIFSDRFEELVRQSSSEKRRILDSSSEIEVPG